MAARTKASDLPEYLPPALADAKPGSVKHQILKGAVQAFGELGYGATSVEAILDRASVSRRTFYRFFRSKEDVFEQLFERSVQMLLNAMSRAMQAQPDPRAKIEAAVEAYIDVHVKAGPLAHVLLLEQFRPGSALLRRRDDARQAFIELIQRERAAAGAPEADPLLLHGVIAALNQIAVRMAAEYPNGEWDTGRGKRAMLRIFRALVEPEQRA